MNKWAVTTKANEVKSMLEPLTLEIELKALDSKVDIEIKIFNLFEYRF